MREPYWWPMAAPPLVARNDFQFDTCEHGYPAEDGCRRDCPVLWVDIVPDVSGFLHAVRRIDT